MDKARGCRRNASVSGFKGVALALAAVAAPGVACAADVTYERLLNPEPQNWLHHHRDFNAQRHSPLTAIDKANIKNLKLAFAVPLGGKSAGESLEATPLVDDGYMYMVDSWGVVTKIDVRSGTAGKIIWKMDPKLEKQDRNRGVGLWGNYVISVTGYAGHVIATDKETGQVVWDKNLTDQDDLELTAAPLALKDVILVGGSGADRGGRNWVEAIDAKTGEVVWKTYSIPAPGEPGSETWKDTVNAWRTGGGAFYGTGAFDPSTNLTYWGSGNPVPAYDNTFRPGDNLFTSSAIAFNASNGKITWWHQYTPNENRDYDETGAHILIDAKINGEDRKILSHAGRNGFTYSFDRVNGQFLKATQHVKDVTWTKGIDPKTGKPVDYDWRSTAGVPEHRGWHQLLAGVLQPKNWDALHPGLRRLQPDHSEHRRPRQRQVQRRNAGRGRLGHQFHHHARSAHRRDQEARRIPLSKFVRHVDDSERFDVYRPPRRHVGSARRPDA
jgi:alcohol dehydrogenase (cytochrome c)